MKISQQRTRTLVIAGKINTVILVISVFTPFFIPVLYLQIYYKHYFILFYFYITVIIVFSHRESCNLIIFQILN
jgi:hypothetical protein